MGMIGNTPYQGQVGSGNIQDGSIDTIDIKDLAVTSAKLNFNDQIANSVPYLNGSKVLTTGSALTFDGTNLGVSSGSISCTVANAAVNAQFNGATGYLRVRGYADSTYGGELASFAFAGGWSPISMRGSYALFEVAGSEQMRLTSTGLGIGTSSPVAILHTKPTGTSNGSVNSRTGLHIQNNNITTGTANARIQFSYATDAPKAYIEAGVYGVDYLAFSGDGSAERMRIDSSGNLLIGTTQTGWTNTDAFTYSRIGSEIYLQHSTSKPDGNRYIWFVYNGSNIGSISQNGTTGVSFNTTSDYRLKENIQPMQNALDVVAQLNPVTYTWKADGSDGQGFIAHELQAVVPDCVTGEKDAVNAEGSPVYQGIDTSFLVATLCKAIQELKAEVNELRSKLIV